MHLRKQMVLRLRQGELSVSEAAREYGVSRATARLWRDRAGEVGLEALAELSRRPARRPATTERGIEEAVLRAKAAHPAWGAKKILASLWPEGAPISVRTGDRLLSRNGLVGKAGRPKAPPSERSTPQGR